MAENVAAPCGGDEVLPVSAAYSAGDENDARNDSGLARTSGNKSSNSSSTTSSPQKRKLSAADTASNDDAEAPAIDADAIKMFVGQIPKTWDESDARRFFETYGVLHQIYILRDKADHTSRGCCFVTYCTRDAALRAQRALHDVHRLPGMKHAVQMKPADNESKNERKLFVGMIPKTYTERDVENLFSSYGTVEETSILRDSEGKSRGCAFVTFASKSSVWQSIRGLNLQTTLPGCSAPVVVKLADSQRDRDRRRSVQSLLLSMGIDCRGQTGVSLIRLFSGTQQPYASMDLNEVRQLILTNSGVGGANGLPGGALGNMRNNSIINSSFSGSGNNDATIRSYGARMHEAPAMPFYNNNSSSTFSPNRSIISSPLDATISNGNVNAATIQLLSQFLYNAPTAMNDATSNILSDTYGMLAQQQQMLPVAPQTNNNNFLNGLISVLSKSLANEQSSLTPSNYAATTSTMPLVAANQHFPISNNTGGAFASASYNANGGVFVNNNSNNSSDFQRGASSLYDQQQLAKRQRTSNQGGRNYHDQQY